MKKLYIVNGQDVYRDIAGGLDTALKAALTTDLFDEVIGILRPPVQLGDHSFNNADLYRRVIPADYWADYYNWVDGVAADLLSECRRLDLGGRLEPFEEFNVNNRVVVQRIY